MDNLINVSANLKTIEVSKFAYENRSHYELYPILKADFDNPQFFLELGNNFITHIFMTKEYYQIVSNKKTIGTFNMIVPHTIKLKINIKVFLYIKSTLEANLKDEIKNSFLAFDFNTDFNNHLINEIKRLNLDFNDVSFETVFSLEKVDENGQATTFETIKECRERILNSFNQNDTYSKFVTITKEDGSILSRGEYLSYNEIKVFEIKPKIEGETTLVEFAFELEEDNKGSQNKGDLDDLKELIKSIAKNNIDGCNELPFRKDITLVEVDDWPSYAVVWKWKWVIVGQCKCNMFVPVAMRKFTKQTLIVYIAQLKEYVEYIQNQINSCAEKAALHGTVVGLVTSSLDEAITTFRALFTDCVSYHLQLSNNCLVSGLFLKEETKEDWHEFI